VNGRYSRQVLFSPIGKEGQDKINQARVAVLGCGALGSVASEMLARAGVGYIKIIDRDFVEASNLQRQSLFLERHAREGIPKAVAAREILGQINSDIRVDARVEDITPSNIESLLADSDFLVDGSDNFELRFLVNDYSFSSGKPWFYAGALAGFGMAFPVIPGETPCLRCFFHSPPPAGTTETCETAGIIAPVVHAVTACQVTQVLRKIVGRAVSRSILQVDIWKNEWRTVRFDHPVADCPCCGRGELEFLKGRPSTGTVRLCGRNAVQVTPRIPSVSRLEEIASRFDPAQVVVKNPYLVRLELEGCELTLFRDGRMIVKGTDNPSLARSLYSKYIGC